MKTTYCFSKKRSVCMPPFNLSTLVTNPVVQAGVFLPFVLVVIDFLTGSLAAMRQGTFDFSKWSNLYQPSQVNDLVRCMISAVVVALVALLGALFWGDQGAGLAASVSALLGVTTISTKIIKSIASNLSEISHVPEPMIEGAIDQFIGLPAPSPDQATTGMPVVAGPSYSPPQSFGN